MPQLLPPDLPTNTCILHRLHQPCQLTGLQARGPHPGAKPLPLSSRRWILELFGAKVFSN